MTTRHLIADGDLSLLCDINADLLVNSGGQLVAVGAVEYLYVNYDTAYAVRNSQGVITYLARLLAEDSAEQSLLCVQLGLALRGNLADKDIAGVYLRADAYDTALVQILQSVV